MIDSHLHVWQLGRGWYPWNTPALGPLHADSSVDDVGESMAASDVDAVILVQADKSGLPGAILGAASVQL